MGCVLLNLLSNQKIKLECNASLVIGRKNVDGCSDKKVSRNHCKITCIGDGNIRLVALNKNPCFFTKNSLPPILPINKDEEKILKGGDSFGLLHDSFWFQISPIMSLKSNALNSSNQNLSDITNPNDNVKLSNLSNLNLEQEVTCMDTLLHNDNCNNTNPDAKMDKNNYSSEEPSSVAGSSGVYRTSKFEETKRLPLWMYQIDGPVEVKKRNFIKVVPENNESPIKRIKTETDNSDDNLETENLKVISVKEVVIKEEKENPMPSSSGCTASSVMSNVQDSSNNCDLNNRTNTKKDGYESDVQENLNHVPSNRPFCQYEARCYRRNPQHKLDFSHPGDEDYMPYENRPTCQYGASCYRKNEQHKINFRHPASNAEALVQTSSPSCSSPASPPLPSKRCRKKVERLNIQFEDEDEFDMEDPFLDDASSDEYIPSQSDREEE